MRPALHRARDRSSPPVKPMRLPLSSQPVQSLAGALLLAALPATALAQEDGGAASASPVDVGVIKNSDVRVVQKLLYTKEGRAEYGFALGWLPFDSYTTTPIGAVQGGWHFNEEWAVGATIDGGYAIKNFTYRQLESDAYGIQPDAYAHLVGTYVDVQWSPIYAKFSWRGKKVVHHDIYFLGGLGGSLEQAMMPDGTTTFSPGLALGVGMRVFTGPNGFLRIQFRDDLMLQERVKTADSQARFLKQNAGITVGYSFLSGKGK